MMDTRDGGGSAWRRRQRRLHSWWRDEQQSIAAVLATKYHHSYVPRTQTTARTREGGIETHCTAEIREHFTLVDEEEDDVLELDGGRPWMGGTRARFKMLLDVRVPQLGGDMKRGSCRRRSAKTRLGRRGRRRDRCLHRCSLWSEYSSSPPNFWVSRQLLTQLLLFYRSECSRAPSTALRSVPAQSR